MILLAWLACRREEEPPAPDESPVDTAETDTGDTTPTGDTAGDTAEPCVPTDEVFGDGIDQACNGWADELGIGESAADAATITILGTPGDGEIVGRTQLGRSVDAGPDLDGVPWLAIGGWNVAGADEVPPDGSFELTIIGGDIYDDPGYRVAITNWGPLLVTADISRPSLDVSEGTGIQNAEYDAYASLVVAPFGLQLADVAGDGHEELLVGGAGTLAVYDAPTTDGFGPERLRVNSMTPPSQNFAYQVGEVGDLTGDGLVEITAYQEDDDVGGRAYILPGNLTGTVLNTDVGWSLVGEYPDGQAGWGIALGDVDGDGYLDLVSGAFLAAERGGISYVYPGPITEDGFLADGIARFEPLFDNDGCGTTVEMLPDQDGDGTDEVVIGCPRDRYFGVPLPGRVEIYAGSRVSGTLDGQQADRVLVGSSPYDQFGYSMTADGDATGDGVSDLVVGAPFDVTGGIYVPSGTTHTEVQVSGAVYIFASPLW